MIRNVQLKRVPDHSYKTDTLKYNPLKRQKFNMTCKRKNQKNKDIDVYLHGMGRTVRI